MEMENNISLCSILHWINLCSLIPFEQLIFIWYCTIIRIVLSLLLMLFSDDATYLINVLFYETAYKNPPILKKLFYIINVSCTVVRILMRFSWFISCLWWCCLRILLEFFCFSDWGNTLVLACINTVYGYPCLWYV